MHHEISKLLNSELNQTEKIAKLKRMAYDAAEKQVADQENMPNMANGDPDLKEIVDTLNELSGKHYKIADFYPHH